MITVSISINNQTIYARTAVNISKENVRRSHNNVYKLDDGSLIKHQPEKGAVKLAIEMLKTIKEVK